MSSASCTSSVSGSLPAFATSKTTAPTSPATDEQLQSLIGGTLNLTPSPI